MRPWWLRYKRGWFVWNPGSGGGGGTVTTDGVTIQGNGSGGSPIALKQVETDATLTGAGTIASPLSVVSNAVTFFTVGSAQDHFGVSQNNTVIFGFVNPVPLTFSHIMMSVVTADAGNNTDFGIYTAAGVLVADIGAQVISGTGNQGFPTVQGSKTIAPGLYIFAITSAGTAFLYNGSNGFSWVESGSAGVTSGGALAASITAPVASVVDLQANFALF